MLEKVAMDEKNSHEKSCDKNNGAYVIHCVMIQNIFFQVVYFVSNVFGNVLSPLFNIYSL